MKKRDNRVTYNMMCGFPYCVTVEDGATIHVTTRQPRLERGMHHV